MRLAAWLRLNPRNGRAEATMAQELFSLPGRFAGSHLAIIYAGPEHMNAADPLVAAGATNAALRSKVTLSSAGGFGVITLENGETLEVPARFASIPIAVEITDITRIMRSAQSPRVLVGEIVDRPSQPLPGGSQVPVPGLDLNSRPGDRSALAIAFDPADLDVL